MKARIPGQSNMSQANMMKKIQEMQNEMARVQQEVEEAEYSATVGGNSCNEHCSVVSEAYVFLFCYIFKSACYIFRSYAAKIEPLAS